MSVPIIRVEQLGKRYRIRHQANRGGYRRLSEDVWNAVIRPFSRGGVATAHRSATTEDFWALKDVSFDVQPGEVVGIIGRNGAGKSTLLKILSRITEPTSGRVRLRGRLASLLEVGTGFHPELTGRENIYLNGAVLGMTRSEIKRKFDEIVAFAEVEQFLDTPVKRYSSGMYVRLAFAVAAHLEPEILVVDEVLAVGDAEFQKKCLGKMKDVAEGGRTVLFVSHNLSMVETLCTRGIIFQDGRSIFDGSIESALAHYSETMESGGGLDRKKLQRHLTRSGQITIHEIDVRPIDGGRPWTVPSGGSVQITLRCNVKRRVKRTAVRISLKTLRGVEVLRLSTMPISGIPIDQIEGDFIATLTIDNLPLTGGRYLLSVAIDRPNIESLIWLEDIGELRVLPVDRYGSGLLLTSERGLIVADHSWEIHQPSINPADRVALTPAQYPFNS